ncbi:MAG: MmgE/PrpD family protein [Chloroflexi bacterium]|nr:MmgE/PrpD family protein [Chloroflexota bacterium]
MDAAHSLAQHVAGIRFEDIPAGVLKVAKMDILDTLGTAVAATSLAPGCREVVELVKEGGGKEESTIIGFGGRAPSWMAALANGTLAHALEYDECHVTAQIHSGVTVVPASFAIAERLGKVNGKTFLTAVVSGIDLGCRLSVAAPRERSWHATTLFGFFGAATAAGKILGLNGERMQHALGIAYSQAAGNTQASTDGSLTKRVQAGFASKGGVLSALLAEKGITGAINSLEGEFGLYKVYYGGKYNPAPLTSDLGKKFEVSNLSFKPYPSPRGTHASIDATLELVREHDIKPEDVESITVFKSAVGVKVLATPIERKRRPENVVDAQFNIPFTVATAVLKRRVGLSDFLPGALKDPAVLQMAQKVNVQESKEFDPNNFHPGITEIRTRQGKVYTKRVDEPYGNPDHPIPQEHLIQKFMECTSNAIRPLPEKNLKSVIDMIMKLEELEDVSAIVRLLAQG